jgi:hypothetical protein
MIERFISIDIIFKVDGSIRVADSSSNSNLLQGLVNQLLVFT